MMVVGLLRVFLDLLVRMSYQPPSPVDDNEESGQSVNKETTPLDISMS
jgi:hypothetical protein